MSTRTAKDGSVFHQNRYASSPEFERGLIGNLVAKRCEILNDKAERELIWFLHHLSHQPGGIAALAAELVSRFGDRLGTAAMVKSRKKAYQSEDIKKIRLEIPKPLRSRFPLKGEAAADIRRLCGLGCGTKLPYSYRLVLAEQAGDKCGMEAIQEMEAKEHGASLMHPSSYSATAFLELCREAATNGLNESDTDKLQNELCRLCLDPGCHFTAAAPWYFDDMFNVLRDYKQQWISENSGAFVTALGKKVCAALDYALNSRSLVLLEGNARLGKSFAARAWCLQHPGQARFVEVPPGNDDTSFFRALARGLGLGNFLKYKTIDIRERVESVLLTGDLILVLDESNRLWPERNFRYAYPSRITWLMAMANAAVPICMVSTPQFIQSQKVAEKTGWNSAQLTGRIGHYEFLPTKLSESDIIAVAAAVLPEAGRDVLQALAEYASVSARYLAAVETIAKRARYTAQMAGHIDCNASDIRKAMKESVIPSDTMLVRTLEQSQTGPVKARKLSPVPAVQAEIEVPLRDGGLAPTGFNCRGETSPELIKG